MSSEDDILVADSDSDSHTVDSRARILSLSRRYRSGQNLFIMSASVKSELRNNPWSHKRKRGASEEHIDRYFPVKKLLEVSETQKVKHVPIREPSTASSAATSLGNRTNGQEPEITPFWDKTLQKTTKYDENARARCPQPTARVIDFRSFDSQRRPTPEQRSSIERYDGDPSAKLAISLTSPSKLETVDVVNTLTGSGMQAHNVLYKDDLDNRVAVDQALDSRHCPMSHSTVQPELASTPRIDGIPLSPISAMRHSPLEHLSNVRQLKVFESDLSIDTRRSPVEPRSTSTTQNIGTGNDEADLLFSNTHIDTVEQVLQPVTLNTQAELASAQRSLAEAIRFEDQPIERPTSDTGEQVKDRNSIEKHLAVAQKPKTVQIQGSICADGEAEKNAYAAETEDHEFTRTVVPTTSSIADATQTPPRSNRRISTFAQFESPAGTQESYLGFGSPLTFTPLRPSNETHMGLSARMDHTIDNIQKYLNASNFDAEQEARKFMDQR